MAQREGKVSLQQKEVIVEYMEHNIPLALGKVFRSETGPTYHQLWDKLTLILNNTPGPQKDKVKWQRVWCDIKNKIRQKLKEMKAIQYSGTPHLQIKLTPLEERIVNIIIEKKGDNEIEEFENITQNQIEFNLKPIKTYERDTKDHINIIEAVYLQDMPSTSKEVETMVQNDSTVEPREYEEHEQYSTNFEENSGSSWNSHVFRHGKNIKKEMDGINNAVHDKIDTISLQIEQIIEQNNITNSLLERIAKALENKNNS